MVMKELSASGVHEAVTAGFDLDAEALDMETVEVISASLRRAAGLLCPCTHNTLVSAVAETCIGLVPKHGAFKENVTDTLNAIIAHGDLFELQDVGQGTHSHVRSVIYLVPPSFVRRHNGTVLLLGVLPDNIPILPRTFSKCIEYANHVRLIRPSDHAPTIQQLVSLGFNEIQLASWLKKPRFESSAELVEQVNRVLDSRTASGEMEDLEILDPHRNVMYYRGRWVHPDTQTGRFIGRRHQAFGSRLWCFVELSNGVPVRFTDLPLAQSVWRACDDAWMLQAAIDRELNNPQVVRRRIATCDNVILDFFSPLPGWAERRMLSVGRPASSKNCLFSIAFHKSEVDEEITFLRENLWMRLS